MDKDYLSKVGAVALNVIFGYEPKFSHNIIDALGSADAVFSLPQKDLRDIFGPYNKYLSLINGESLEKAAGLTERLLSRGYGILSIYDDGYPALLRECEDAPMVLYVRSSTPAEKLFNSRPAVSIVGTRDISPYGKEWCTRIVDAIASAPSKPLIVSGLAIGVDITAHMAAMDCGLPTIAVLPVGIEDVYPARHGAAAREIASRPGCALITDYPPGTTPQAFTFLRRNRIIAGISQATILVESKAKGGGTMTARLASGYGREVLALPGRIDDVRSQGCNRLLREKVAEPIDSLDNLPLALGLGLYDRRRKGDLERELRDRYEAELGEDRTREVLSVALLVKKNRGISVDEICRALAIDYSEALQITGLLEGDGFIETDLLQRCAINAKKY